MAARKLRHYLEGHIIRVITNEPLTICLRTKKHPPESSNRALNYQNTL
jgi:hypothetical protein